MTKWPGAEAAEKFIGPKLMARALALLCLVVFTTRLPYLWTPALWIDESFSIFYAAKGFESIWGRDWLVDPTPPGYYSLLAIWETGFGKSEPVLRLLSVGLTCVTAANIASTGRVLGSLRGGVLAALIWLMTPLGMEYSLEIRAYALQLAALSGLLLASAAMLTRSDRTPEAWRAAGLYGFVVTALSLLAFYTHVTSLFPILGVALAMLVHFVRNKDAREIRMWLGFSVLFVIGAAPQVRATYFVMSGNGETLAWLPAGTLSWMAWTGRALLLGEITAGLLTKGLVAIGWTAGLANGFWRWRGNHAVTDLLVLAPAIGIAMLLAFNLSIPILLPRTAMWVCIPMALLAGLGLARTPGRFAVPALVAAGAMLFFVSQRNMERRAEWRSERHWLETIAARDADPVVVTVDGERACMMAYYGFFAGRVRLLDLEKEQVFDRTQNVALGCNEPPPVRVAELRSILQAGEPVWVVASTDPSEDRNIEVVKLTKLLDGVARRTETIDKPGFYAGRFAHAPQTPADAR